MNILAPARTAFNSVAARALVCVLLVTAFAAGAHAQSATDGTTPSGMTPGSPAGSYALSDFDTINPYNGGLNFRLPLLTVAGRGSARTALALRIEQKWTAHKELNPGQNATFWAEAAWWSDEGGGQNPLGSGRMMMRKGVSKETPIANGCGGYVARKSLTRITFIAPDGTEYELRDQATGGQTHVIPAPPQCSTGFNRGRVFVTSDGSSATFISDADIIDAYYHDQQGAYEVSGYMLFADGTRYRVQVGEVKWVRDRNGNVMTFSYDLYGRLSGVTDSLGRQVTVTYAAGAITYDEISFAGFGGAPRTLRINHVNLSAALRSGFTLTQAQFPELNGGAYNPKVVNYLELPDGRRYNFQYNNYAELARVELPTGGAMEYDHAAGLTDGAASGVFNLWNGTSFDRHIYRRVVERRVYAGGGTGSAYDSKMTYSRAETTTANQGYVVVEQCEPGGTTGQCGAGTLLGRTVHYYQGSPRVSFGKQPTDYPGYKEGREYKSEVYDTNGTTLLRKVENTWQQPLAGATWPLTQAETDDAARPNDPQITQTLSTLADTNQVSKQTFAYDRYSNRTDVYEHDYGTTPGTTGSVVRRTHTDFLTTNPVNGVDYASPVPTASSPHMRGLPKQVSVYDAAGVEQSRATFEYDNYAADASHAPPADRFNITGLCTTFDAAGACSNASPASYVTRGNATGTAKYLLTNGAVTGSISAYQQYDVAGNAVKSIDARGKVSTVGYADSFCNGPTCGGTYNLYTYAFPTSANSPVPDPAGQYGSTIALTTSTVYDFYTGLAYSATDANNKTTLFGYEDQSAQLDRLKSVVRPDGGRTDFYYGDTVGSLYVRTLTDLDAARRTESRQYFDGLGRGVRAFTWENQDASKPWLTADTQYDALGRAWRGSNQYRSAGPGSAMNPSGRWTETTFDALGRAKQVKTTADGAYFTTSYAGNAVTVTDQHDSGSPGRSRKSVADALGRMTEVYEDPSGLNYLTSYQYDALGNLRTVTQGTQPGRTFVYDSLGRLTSATNPESGTVGYTYDDSGNVLTKTDARGVTVTYAYDALSRNTTTDYSDTAAVNPDVRRYYDTSVNGRGRYNGFCKGGDCTAGANVEHTSIDSFDSVGRPLVKRQLFKTNGVWSPTYRVELTYDRAGNVLTETYPSNHTVNYSYDAAGRPGDNGSAKAFSGDLGDGVARTYSSEVRYHEAGGREQERFGTDTPVYNKALYNSRGQLAEIRVSTYGILSAGHETDWNRGAIINHYSTSAGAWGATGGGLDNNGNLKKQDIYLPDNDLITGHTQSTQFYDYDALNRLYQARESYGGSNVWLQYYDYDRWGNRTINATNTTGSAPEPQFTVDPSTNRLGVPSGQSGAMSYDAAGNLTNDTYQGGGARTYDAEGRMTSAQFVSGQTQTALYAYDGDGSRTRRKAGAGGEVWQVYGFGGELLAEYAAGASPASPQKEYGYRSGGLLVTAEPAQVVAETYRASTDFSNVQGQRGWYYLDSTGAQMTFDTANNQWRGAETYNLIWAGGAHPGGAADSVRRWVSPGAGSVRITGSAADANSSCGDGVVVTIKKGTQVLWQQTVNNGNTAGLSYDITTAVAAGDQISFAVNRRGEYSCDATNFDPEITYTGATPTGLVNWLVADQLGTPRMVVDKSGSLSSMKRHDYLPFGEEIGAGVGGRTNAQGYATDNVRQKFTGYERDDETELDYAQARFYANVQGRFTSVDSYDINIERQSTPNKEEAEATYNKYLLKPQQWNRYAYAINNPLRYIDPSGEKIQLTGNENERRQQFAELQKVVGPTASEYLYVREEMTTNADGSTTTNYYADYRANDPNRTTPGPSFDRVNDVAADVAKIIDNPLTVGLSIVKSGTLLTDHRGRTATIGPVSSTTTPAATGVFGGKLMLYFMDPSTSPGKLPGSLMQDGKPGTIYPGSVLGHDLGHVLGIMSGRGNNTHGDSLQLENKVRRLYNKKAVPRTGH